MATSFLPWTLLRFFAKARSARGSASTPLPPEVSPNHLHLWQTARPPTQQDFLHPSANMSPSRKLNDETYSCMPRCWSCQFHSSPPRKHCCLNQRQSEPLAPAGQDVKCSRFTAATPTTAGTPPGWAAWRDKRFVLGVFSNLARLKQGTVWNWACTASMQEHVFKQFCFFWCKYFKYIFMSPHPESSCQAPLCQVSEFLFIFLCDATLPGHFFFLRGLGTR